MTVASGGGEGVALARSIARTGRPAGSDAERRARRECAAYLERRGFRVVERQFEYSSLPARWAAPVIGAYMAMANFAAAIAIGREPELTTFALGALAGFALLLCLGAWWNARWGTRERRLDRGVNLVARRGVPELWFVAHLDTKGQPVSLLVRAGGVVLIAVGWLVTLGGWIVYAFGIDGAAWVTVVGLVVAGIGAAPLAASVVLDRGTGALDNASGIACIFEAIDQLDPDFSVGVLVTTAEELALAGARAWADHRPPGIALNCDGVDDEGETVCVVGRDRSGRLARAIERATEATGTRVHVRRSLPGVLFDSVALADAGWDAMTVTRGTLRSLARVHTARDTLGAWEGRGVAGVAAFLAAAAGAIVAEQHEAQQGARHGDHPARRGE